MLRAAIFAFVLPWCACSSDHMCTIQVHILLFALFDTPLNSNSTNNTLANVSQLKKIEQQVYFAVFPHLLSQQHADL